MTCQTPKQIGGALQVRIFQNESRRLKLRVLAIGHDKRIEGAICSDNVSTHSLMRCRLEQTLTYYTCRLR